MTWSYRILLASAISTAAVYEFSPALHSAFVYQDNRWQAGYEADLLNKAAIKHDVFTYSRTLMQTSWKLQSRYTPSAQAFHIVNLLLHLLTAILVGFLAYLVFLPESSAWFAGAFFLLSPAQMEVAAYISGRTEAFAAIGLLLTCISVLLHRTSLRERTALAILTFIAGLAICAFSKESAVIVFFMVPLVREPWHRLPFALALTTLIIISYAASRLFLVHQWSWILTQSVAAWHILWATISTSNIAVVHDYSQISLATQTTSTLLLLAIPTTAWFLRRREPVIAIGLFTIFIVILPRLLVQPDTSTFNDHQFYFGRVGIALILARAFAYLPHQKSETV